MHKTLDTADVYYGVEVFAVLGLDISKNIA